MKVRELIAKLLDARNMDFDVVIQRSYEDGGFTLHPVLLQVDGHIGHSGPVLQLGESLDIGECAKTLEFVTFEDTEIKLHKSLSQNDMVAQDAIIEE